MLRAIKHKLRLRTRYRSLKKKVGTAAHIYRTEGVRGFMTYIKRGLKKRLTRKSRQINDINASDVLIISIDEPLLDRYRADHMLEQFESTGVTADRVYYHQLTKEHARRYNTFIFYRCPWMDEFADFFKEAKKQNKALVYSVDDLVIDTKYTDVIPVVQAMNPKDRELYDDGVRRHKKVMEHCDYAIVTTTHLANEIKKYKNIKKVFISRNAMSDEMVDCSNRAIKEVSKDDEKFVIGYFSGTATHNEDFQLVAPALTRILDKYDHVYIKLAGRVDAPEELKDYADRIIYTPYVDWRKLPLELRKSDIILAPLVDSFFNRAKSEIKWSEGSLVGVPVIASDMGAFRDMIQNSKTGVLVENTHDAWFAAIEDMIQNEQKRQDIGEEARNFVLSNCRTVGKNAVELKAIIEGITPKVIGFAGVSLSAISGGNIVVKRHMDILKDAGYIVYGIESMDYRENDTWLEANRDDDKKYNIFRINSARKKDKVNLNMSFDRLVATFWPSVDIVDNYRYMKAGGEKLYLVQNMEAEFYSEAEQERVRAMATYSNPRVKPITISKWCESWLKADFGRSVKRASNGIDLAHYPVKKRDFSGRIKILIEGDSSSEYKNTDEAFRIVEKLDPEKYEISYLSYNKQPKEWYRVDHFYNKIDPDKVGEVYAGCDILIKTSILESFSYPPLEMMATGGLVVVLPNEGNVEYLQNRENCLFYKRGDIDDGVKRVEELIGDKDLRSELIVNGLETATKYSWDNQKKSVTSLYK